MAQTIKLRRSASQGALPTTSQLDLGEVAINTYDGKLYIKKDDGTESIVQVNPLSTSDLPEGSNLYFTTSRVASAIASNLSTGYIDLTTISNPAHSEGRIFYDTANNALAVYNDAADITLQVGQEEWIQVFNNSGDTILNGTPVYLTGESAGIPTISPTNASGDASAYCIGLATHDISNNNNGYVTVRGLVRDIDTSTLTAGARVHIGIGTGVLSTSAPTYPYYTTDIGICLVSGVSGGCIYVDIQNQHTENFRTVGDLRVGNDLTVSGNFTVLGSQSTVAVNNLTVDNSFIYSNSGNSIGDDGTTFDGTGLDDATFTGHYNGTTTSQLFYVKIDGVGTGTGGVDTFAWSFDNFVNTEASGIDITGGDQLIASNINIKFISTTGHTLDDMWYGSASPLNVDVGFASNRNTGASGVGYTHVGAFFDTTDETWKFFSEYAPEPEGNIDTTHASFSLAPLQVGSLTATTLSGALTGNVTGDVTGNVTGTVSSLSNHTTDDIIEGTSNLFYTDARARSAISTEGYLTAIPAEYLTQTEGDVRYLQSYTETDPIYTSSSWYTTTNNSTNWDTAYTWGDHSTQSYATQTYVDTAVSNSAGSDTAAEVLTKIKTVDGSGSGLDADLLDGYDATAFATSAQGSNADTAFGWGDHSTEGYLTGNQTITLTGDVSGSGTTSISVTVADDSHNHVIANVDGLQAALDAKLDDSQKGAANGLAELDGSGKVPSAQLPSYVDDVLEYANSGSFPGTGETGKIYIALDTNDVYRWTGSAYVKVSDAVSTADEANTLATARTISLAGDVTGSTSFDGSANVSITATVADDSHNHIIANVDGLQAALDGKQAAGTYNTIIGTDSDIDTSGSTIIDNIFVTDGVITSMGTRTLTLGDLGYTGETNATADQTASEILTAIKTVDGSGSGLDADLLDGQQGSYYYPASNPNGYTNDQTASEILTAIKTVDGSGSGLDADTVDGRHEGNFVLTSGGVSANLDTEYRAGMFGWSTSTTGKPSSLYGQGLSIVNSGDSHNNSNNWITQLGFGTDMSTAYFRGKTNSGGWGSWYTLFHTGNDGSGSGLDADLLDGQQGSYYAAASSLSSYLPLSGGTMTGDLLLDSSNAEINLKSGLTGTSGAINWTFNTTSTNYAAIALPYDTRATTGLHIDSGYPITIDASTSIDFAISGSKKGYWDNSGLFVGSSKVWHAGNDGSGSGLDADLLDGVQGSSFLRSDAADQKTSGTLRFNDNVIASFGSSDDFEIYHATGSHSYMEINTGDLYIRQGAATNRYLFDVSLGDFHADGNIIAYSTSVSDERLKDDINTLEDPLRLIDELRGVTFTRKDQQEKSSGVIAQELEKVMPWAVKESQARILKGDETVYKTVEYDALSALFIEAIKELKAEVDDLKQKLENK